MTQPSLDDFYAFRDNYLAAESGEKGLLRETAEDAVEAPLGGLAGLGQSVLNAEIRTGYHIDRFFEDDPTYQKMQQFVYNANSTFFEHIAAPALDFFGFEDSASKVRSTVAAVDSVKNYWDTLSLDQQAAMKDAAYPEIMEVLDRHVTGRQARPDYMRPDTVAGGFVEAVVQIAGPYKGGTAVASSGTRALGLFQGAGKAQAAGRYLTTQIGGGAIADFVAFQGDEGRLADFTADLNLGPISNNALVEFLKTNENDSEFSGRLKNALEGAVLGPFIDASISVIGRGWGKVRGAPSIREVEATPVLETDLDTARYSVESGELPPEVAEAMGVEWEPTSPAIEKGPSRTKFWKSASDAGESAEVVTAAKALTDSFAIQWAKSTGRTVDDFYSTKLNDIARGESDTARGRVSFLEDGKATITLFQSSNASTLIHEMSHVFRRNLSELDESLQQTADTWVGAKDGKKWSRKQEEKWASAFETYLFKGEAPTPELDSVFTRMKEMLTSVYASVLKSAGLNSDAIKIDPQIRNVFDSMFGKPYNQADINNPRPSNRTPNTASKAVTSVRDSYVATWGGERVSGPRVFARLSDEDASVLAAAYDKAEHAPLSPEVESAYSALTKETRDQFDHITEEGYEFVFSSKNTYNSAQALTDDIEKNRRVFVRLGGRIGVPADHPLAAPSGVKALDVATNTTVELTQDDLLKAVHDFFGHAADGNQFNRRGVENAWLSHAKLYSPEAQKALATETRALNAWASANRAVPQRKAAVLPDWAQRNPDVTPASLDQSLGDKLRDTLFQLRKGGMDGAKALDTAVASHTNFAKINTFEDAVKVLTDIDAAYQGKIDEVIGARQTLEEVAAEAEVRGADPRQLVESLKTAGTETQKLASLIVAGRSLKVGLAEQAAAKAKDLLSKNARGVNDADLENQLIDTLNALGKIDTLVGIVTKEAARATGSGRITVSGFPEAVADSVARKLVDGNLTEKAIFDAANEAAARGDNNLATVLRSGSKKNRAKRMAKVTAGIVDAVSVGQAGRYASQIRSMNDPTILDAFLEVYKAFLLSGTRTFSINALSGGIQTYMQSIARTLGAGARFGTKSGREDFKESARFMLLMHGSMYDVAKMLVMNKDRGKFYTPDVRSGARRTISQESPSLYGSFEGAGLADSATESKKAFRAETFGLRSDSAVGKGVNGLGRIIRSPFLVNMLGEEWWSQVNYLATVRNQGIAAAEEALSDQLLTPAQRAVAIGDFVDSYVRGSFDEFGAAKRNERGGYVHADAVRYAKSVNFMQDLEHGIGQWLLEGKRQFPLMDLVLPFIKAPTNLFRTSARYAVLPGAALERSAKKAGVTRAQWEIDKNRGEMMLGAMMMTFAGFMAGNGMMTGGGPANPDEREALEATGWQPYSFVRISSTGEKEYTAFNRFDPAASVLGLVADAVEVLPYLKTNESDQAAKAMLTGVAHNFSSKTYLRGLSDALEAVMQPDRYGKKYLFNQIANAVPNLSATYAKARDPQMREAYTLLDHFKARIPGLSEDLPPRRNIFGEPVTPTGGYVPFVDGTSTFAKMASPAAYSRQASDPAIEEMARLQVGFSMPGRTIDRVDMTLYRTADGQNAYDRYLELIGTTRLGGKTVAQAVTDLISSPSYKSLPEPTGESKVDIYNPRVIAIQRTMESYRKVARAQMLQEVPDMADEIRRRKLSGTTGVLTDTGNNLSAIDRILSK